MEKTAVTSRDLVLAIVVVNKKRHTVRSSVALLADALTDGRKSNDPLYGLPVADITAIRQKVAADLLELVQAGSLERVCGRLFQPTDQGIAQGEAIVIPEQLSGIPKIAAWRRNTAYSGSEFLPD